MRVLFVSTPGAGHFNPLVPFIDACRRRGHEVLVAGPAALRPLVDGTPLGVLGAGVPQVFPPLFADQPANAARVAAVGAGLVAPPDPAAIREAVERVLADASYRAAAGAVAADMHAAPPVDEAFDPA